MGVFRPKSDDLIEDFPELFEERRLLRGSKGSPPAKGTPAKAPRPAPTTGSFRGFLVRSTMWVAMGLITLSLAPMGAAVGGLAAWLEHAPPVAEFENYNPPEATMILDHQGQTVSALFEQRRFVVPLSEMPLNLRHAFIAIEDERFYSHMGVDPIGVLRAAVTNVMRGRMSQGASTITQQTARNVLSRIGSEKTIKRKLREMLVAIQMEHAYTKDQILEVYLNQIYLGSGTYGVEAASRAYFHKRVQDLSLYECATIAGLPQLPERYSPLNNPDISKARRDVVLGKMWELGLVSDNEFDRAVVRDVTVEPERLSRSEAAYFVDAVRREISNDRQLGGTMLQTAGWRIHTTVDATQQRIAERVLAEGLALEEQEWIAGRQERFLAARSTPEFNAPPARGQVRMARVMKVFARHIVVELPGGWRGDFPVPEATAHFFAEETFPTEGAGVDIEIHEVLAERGLVRGAVLPKRRLQGALVSLDAATGDVRALVGGREYADHANGGFFNRAVLARRQAGSTLKPFFFAAGLEEGMTPWTIVSDTPIIFPDGYAPRNYENMFFGSTTLQTALEKSRNIPTIRVVQRVGLRDANDFVSSFRRTGNRAWELPMEWPVVLGTTPLTPLEVASAYQPLANGGLAMGPRLIRGVRNEYDRETLGIGGAPPPRQLLSSATSANMVQMLVGVMNQGTGHSLWRILPWELNGRVAGKSGTTNDNRDAWFAGFTPEEVVVVWVGFDQMLPLAPGRTGSRAAGPIWARYIAEVWETKTPEQREKEIAIPDGYALVRMNSSGQPATDLPTELPNPERTVWRIAPRRNSVESRDEVPDYAQNFETAATLR